MDFKSCSVTSGFHMWISKVANSLVGFTCGVGGRVPKSLVDFTCEVEGSLCSVTSGFHVANSGVHFCGPLVGFTL